MMEVSIDKYCKHQTIKELESITVSSDIQPALTIAIEILKHIPEKDFDKICYNFDEFKKSDDELTLKRLLH